MKYLTLKLAVIGSLGFSSGLVMADWEPLPVTGVPVTGGTSAYITCNPTGNFGSGSGGSAPVKPSSNSDPCARIVSDELEVPDSSYTFPNTIPIAAETRPVTMNNSYTHNTPITIGEVREVVWRKQTGSSPDTFQCIYAMKVNLFNVDYNLDIAGTQNFEVNDMARAGWTGLNMDVAYSTYPTVSEPTYRIGIAYTAVQHRASGYSAQPLTGLGSNPSINGLNSWPGTASAAQQKADINTNWVDFTTDVNYRDDDGSTSASSGMFYVRTDCSGADPTEDDEAIRLRQTFQEPAGGGGDNPFIEVAVRGFLPTLGSGVATPAHTDPF